jgi:hypothetical protein
LTIKTTHLVVTVLSTVFAAGSLLFSGDILTTTSYNLLTASANPAGEKHTIVGYTSPSPDTLGIFSKQSQWLL